MLCVEYKLVVGRRNISFTTNIQSIDLSKKSKAPTRQRSAVCCSRGDVCDCEAVSGLIHYVIATETSERTIKSEERHGW